MDKKATVPVQGAVYVDGQPAAMLAVQLVPLSQIGKKDPVGPKCRTAEDGTFKFSTYVTDDGVPADKYVMTFQWGTLNMMKRTYDGDQLNGRYIDPAQSTTKVDVEEGGDPIDLGKIELTTK